MTRNGQLGRDRQFGRYAHSLLLFAVGVVLLGHGVAATALAAEVPLLLTTGLSFVGAALAYRSLVRHLPTDSSLSSDGFLIALAGATAAFVNVSVPALYEFVGVSGAGTLAAVGGYWSAFVTAVAGLGALGVYRALASRIRGRPTFARLSGAFAVSIGAAWLFLRELSAHPFPVGGVETVLSPIVGAVLAVLLFDCATLEESDERTTQ